MSRKRWRGHIAEMMDHGDYWVKNRWGSLCQLQTRNITECMPDIRNTDQVQIEEWNAHVESARCKRMYFLTKKVAHQQSLTNTPRLTRVGAGLKGRAWEQIAMLWMTPHSAAYRPHVSLSLNLHLARWSATQIWSSCKWHQRRPWWVGGCLPPLTWSNQDF